MYLDYTVHVVVTNDVIKSGRKRDQTLAEDAEAEALHIYRKAECASYLVFNRNPDLGTVAHECYHCVYRLMRWVGADMDNNEIFAYHLGYLVNVVYTFLKPKK